MPEIIYKYDNTSKIKETWYKITIKPDIYYSPHKIFNNKKRELIAKDYINQIKRLALPELNSPIFGFLSKYIIGLKQLRENIKLDLKKINNKKINNYKIDLNNYNLLGVEEVDKYTYIIKIKGNYPQFIYWLAMPFFAPVPEEVFSNSIDLNEIPIGTGPYMILENIPEQKIVMQKNPNFRKEYYPSIGTKEDREKGLLDLKNQKIPFIDKIVFTLEKESIPYWNKFLQGYYDTSGISSDSFASAINITPEGGIDLSKELLDKGISLSRSISPSIMYWGFNMLDPVIGGYTKEKKLLRQAISIAFDTQEFVSVFTNGRGVVANGPIPPGILGHSEKINPIILNKTLDQAKNLLSLAGYPEGVDKKTKERLVINFEAISSGDPNEKANFSWLIKQFDKLGIDLVIRATDYNRFQEKMSNGDAQMFFWGWNADYPDPENFLFMFYGKNSKVKYEGENASNYSNLEYDKLFELLETMNDNNIKKIKIINKMVHILQEDAPWIFGFHPVEYSLQHSWNYPKKINTMARNTLKYAKINPELRKNKRIKWNKPHILPFFILFIILTVVILPAVFSFIKEQNKKGVRIKK